MTSFLGRLREAAGTYRDNAIIFTLKQNIGEYLKEELSAEQVQLKHYTLTLSDLHFNTDKFNDHVSAAGHGGAFVESLTIRRLEIDTTAVRFEISGVDVAIGVRTRAAAERLAGPTAAPLPGMHTEAPPSTPPRHSAPTGASGGVIDALAACLAELSGLLAAYLRVVISDLHVTLNFCDEVESAAGR